MPEEIRVPELEGATEITLGSWLKSNGDRVEIGEAVAEALTDKVNAEIESPVAGVIEELLVPEGAEVTSGQPIARISTDG
jgi:pyruvate/2-oxoglutarate dehydrogenase complex dihydrolipoamide acyltransferase (E2) component